MAGSLVDLISSKFGPRNNILKRKRLSDLTDVKQDTSPAPPSKNTLNKQIVHEQMQRIVASDAASVRGVLSETYHADVHFRASHPFNDQHGVEAIASSYWVPLLEAFPDLERRDDLLMGGEYEGNDIVGCVGHLTGTFEKPWLGIAPTGKTLNLRYGEYHKVIDGKIVQSSVLLDVLDALHQVGYWPLEKHASLGADGRWAGPISGDGVLLKETDPAEGQAALDYVLGMHKALMGFAGITEEELLSDDNPQKTYWHEKMMWYGPSGIGTCRGMKGFVQHHQMPFRQGFPKRTYGNDLRKLGIKGAGHYVRIGDSHYVGTGGWPSVVAVHEGEGWLGLPPSGKEVHMRVMDFYNIHEGTIRENWVPIDIIHILLQMGVDVLAQVRAHPEFGAKEQ